MKKIISTLLIITLILSLNISVFANDEITVKLNGSEISFDVPPQLINNRTMVPLRAIFEALGATVDWNNETQTVTSTKDNATISLTIDSPTMYVNGVAVTIDSPACLISGRTLVPVRAISEAFGIIVEWDGDTKTVIITTMDNLEIGLIDESGLTILGSGLEAEHSVESNTNTQLCIVKDKKYKLENNSLFTWESSDSSIASIEDGLVKTYDKTGEVTISVTTPSKERIVLLLNVYYIDTDIDIKNLYNKISDEFVFRTGDTDGSAYYEGSLNIREFVKDFKYGDTAWHKATMQIMEEYVAKNKNFSKLVFYYKKNGKGSPVFLGNILYDCYDTKWDDGYSKWWESSEKIIDQYR